MKLYVLMKEREVSPDTSAWDHQQTPHAICGSMEDVQAVIDSIASHKDNRRYKMRKSGQRSWKIGPSGDQGFFGVNAMKFWVIETSVRGALVGQLQSDYE
ncbi:MAG: hypothetical protein OEW83_22525 [Acidimicrobiia bacterium]|nr:hypothetical protein [Acidimicrobiia bacterium]